MQVEQTGKEMTWSTRAGQRGESRTGVQNRSPGQGSRTGMSRTGVQNRDVQTSDFLVKEEDEDKEVPGQGEGERLGSRILVKEEDQDK